jgi:hypothetical protein
MDDNNETFFEALAAVKSKAGMVTYREQLRSPRAKEWYDARVTEINKLKSSGSGELDDFLHVCSILRRSTATSSAAASASAAAIPAPEWLQWLLNLWQWLGGDTE